MKTEAGFRAWLAKVDAAIARKCGLSHLDLGDWRYRDAYEDGLSPAHVARLVLAEEGFYE